MQGIKAPDPGIEQQFCDLVNTYQTQLLRLCYLHLRDKGLAEDAVQETFIKAYKALPNYRGESSMKTWLMRIAINSCRDAQRTGWWKHISRRVSLDMLPELSGDLSEEALTVNLEIARLPGKLREVILLYYFQNLKVNEIAETLGISQSSVWGRLKRGRDRLKTMLEGRELDE